MASFAAGKKRAGRDPNHRSSKKTKKIRLAKLLRRWSALRARARRRRRKLRRKQ